METAQKLSLKKTRLPDRLPGDRGHPQVLFLFLEWKGSSVDEPGAGPQAPSRRALFTRDSVAKGKTVPPSKRAVLQQGRVQITRHTLSTTGHTEVTAGLIWVGPSNRAAIDQPVQVLEKHLLQRGLLSLALATRDTVTTASQSQSHGGRGAWAQLSSLAQRAFVSVAVLNCQGSVGKQEPQPGH